MSEPLNALLIRHERLRLKPYTDTVGKLTIGVGRNLTDMGLTQDEVLLLLQVQRRVEFFYPSQLLPQ